MRPLDLIILAMIVLAFLFYRRKKAGWKSPVGLPSRRQLQAKQLLAAKGYKVEAFSPAVAISMQVDGSDSSFELSSPLVASRGNKIFVVEILPADNRSRLNTVQARNQYLLHQLALSCDGLLLLDLDRQRVQQVEYHIRGRIRPFWRDLMLKALLLLLIMGGAGWLLYSFFFT